MSRNKFKARYQSLQPLYKYISKLSVLQNIIPVIVVELDLARLNALNRIYNTARLRRLVLNQSIRSK